MADADKTEKPTPKRLKDATRDGQVARSQDLTAWSGVLALSYVLPPVLGHLGEVTVRLVHAVGEVAADPEPTRAVALLRVAMSDAGVAMMPLLLATMVVGILASVPQGGTRPHLKRLKPQAKRMNPVQAIKRIFGKQAGWELVKSLLKVAAVGLAVWSAVRELMAVLLDGSTYSLREVLAITGSGALRAVRSAAMIALALAVADYVMAFRRVRRQLRMSRYDVRQESRQQEGDPHVKAGLRARALALSRNRMMAEVPHADVVLVNPTHVAVALSYRAGTGAPRVVAKGAGALAARIRSLASEGRVPLVEDVPLARALYRACEVGQEIPAELFSAVARVLAFVMRLRARGQAAGMHRPPLSPDRQVPSGDALRRRRRAPMRA